MILDIQGHLEPYSKLWTTTHKWQKLEKIWMDGSYWLNGDLIDAETDDLYRF